VTELEKWNETLTKSFSVEEDIKVETVVKDRLYENCMDYLDFILQKFPMPLNPGVGQLPDFTINRTAYWMKEALQTLYPNENQSDNKN